MATEMEIQNAFAGCGFGSSGMLLYGPWKGYAFTALKVTNRSFCLDVAIDQDGVTTATRKALAAELKSAGVKSLGSGSSLKKRVRFSMTFSAKDDANALLRQRLDAIVLALQHSGVAPASVCAISGSPRPDSLCLVNVGNFLSFRPVQGAAVRQQGEQARARTEENQQNGSYVLGLVGALLGMLVGLIPNLLVLILADLISAWLFALVPVCAVLGYKLCKGKMDKGSIAIVVLVSLLGVVLMVVLRTIYYLMHDYGDDLAGALGDLGLLLGTQEYISGILPMLLQMLLFMGLGIWIAWRFMSSQTNSGALQNSEIQQASLRPMPGYEQAAPYGFDPLTGYPRPAPDYSASDGSYDSRG